jgi:hypothetical protein
MSEFYVYIYKDPSKDYNGKPEPFYVGKGSGRRVFVKKSNKQVLGRIRNLKESGIDPIITKIIVGTNEGFTFGIERLFIKRIGRKDLGTGPLLNHTNGGEGASGGIMPESHILRMRLNNPMKKGMTNAGSFQKGRSFEMTDSHKEKISEAKIGDKNINWENPVASKHLNSTRASCICCKIETNIGNIFRWHGDKCRSILI